MEEEKRIVEINGIKVEVDLRHAKVIDHYAIGDNVKVLRKRYSDNYDSHAGVIVGFDNFSERPSLLIAYLNNYDGKIEFLTLNKDSKDVEICPDTENWIPFSKEHVIQKMNNEIEIAEQKVLELRRNKEYFLNNFGRYFTDKE